MTYAVVRNGVVVNMVLWDGKDAWAPPDGDEAVQADDSVGIGYAYNGTEFAPPAD